MSLTPAKYSHEPNLIAVVEPRSLAETRKERAFVDFYDRVRIPGIAYAEYFVGSDSAADIVQSVALRMWEIWDSLTPDRRSTGYFLRAVRNGIVNVLRDEDRFVELTPELEALPDFPTVVVVSEETAREDLLRWMREMIKRMPLRRREVFVLVREFEFTYDEAAQALGISVKTVDAQMQKAREYFEQGLEHGGIRLTKGTIRKLLPSPRTEGSNDE